ncbi:class II fumarate hydratase [Synechococcus elongatus]|uniref:class II fumarate hydratase n=1 Tax=Synechococcus elongatus TaxID=32046 RepID=UPI000F7ED911|nr:class II fumarate hydratase [Synechococcus elongatus]
MTETANQRRESDSMGEVLVPADRYWGAQTQRSLHYFSIGQDRMPIEVCHALAIAKKASALANRDLGVLSAEKADLIAQAADEIIAGQLDDHFPLYVWMTGSGTQANMNVNEVIANRAIEMAGGVLGSKTPIHPNDDVNRSQSSNDVFPTAMHIAAAQAIGRQLLPSIERLEQSLQAKVDEWQGIVKIGRTHLQDAVPLTLGQEFSGFVAMLAENRQRLHNALQELYPLALGGTAVGTGLNAPTGFDVAVADYIAQLTGLPFVTATNKFAQIGAHDAFVALSGSLRGLAVSLYKIANDIRLLACGPRCGFNELSLPANEPGSSIMPGKVNPTQCEALAMVAVQVMGYDAAVAFAGASGYLELNVYKPLMVYNVLESIRILSDASDNFRRFTVEGMTANTDQINTYLERSLMLVTALTPAIGYDQAAKVAKYAFEKNLSLKEACLELGCISSEEFDRWVDPAQLV